MGLGIHVPKRASGSLVAPRLGARANGRGRGDDERKAPAGEARTTRAAAAAAEDTLMVG
jgi:hypothetical protein